MTAPDSEPITLVLYNTERNRTDPGKCTHQSDEKYERSCIILSLFFVVLVGIISLDLFCFASLASQLSAHSNSKRVNSADPVLLVQCIFSGERVNGRQGMQRQTVYRLHKYSLSEEFTQLEYTVSLAKLCNSSFLLEVGW